LVATAVNGATTSIANSIRSNGASVRADFANGISLIDTEILARNNVLIDTTGNFEIRTSPAGAIQSILAAVEGALVAKVGGDWLGQGALIQGGNTAIVADDAVAKACVKDKGEFGKDAVSLSIAGNFLNETVEKTNLGIVFSEKGSLRLDVKGNLVNRDARIISNSSLDLSVGGTFVNEAVKDGEGAGEQNSVSVSTAYGFLRRRTETRSIDHGALLIPGEHSFVVANGDIHIAARDFINRGADINANDGSILIQAQHSFLNESLRVGKAEFHQHCLIFCRASSSGSVTPVGGNLNASRDVRIEAGDTLDNIGGTVTAINHLALVAPRIRAASIEAIAALGLYRGLASKFGSTWATLHAYEVGGVFRAATGGIQIDGDILMDGGNLIAASGVEITGTKTAARPAVNNGLSLPPLGLFFKSGG